MNIHREPVPAGGEYVAVIVHGAPSAFIRSKEERGITDLWLWKDEHDLLCAAWKVEKK